MNARLGLPVKGKTDSSKSRDIRLHSRQYWMQ